MSKPLIREHDIESLINAIDPALDPDDILAAVEFQEMHKPWGDPVRMTDTQPIEALDPDQTLQAHRGFALVEEETAHGDD